MADVARASPPTMIPIRVDTPTNLENWNQPEGTKLTIDHGSCQFA
jgi:hypothetical protein